MISGDNWDEIESLFSAGLGSSSEARQDLLRTTSPELAYEVKRLWESWQKAGNFLDASVDAVERCSLLKPGQQVAGRFLVVDQLGEGGMSEVYSARDAVLGRLVALKVLRPNLTTQRGELEREARTISSLSHPNIRSLYDLCWEQDSPILVMEHLEGETLAERLARGAMSELEALGCALDILKALDHAHKRGVIHKDVKPGNVFLTETTTKLLDFGISTALGHPEQTGSMVIGSPHYMSPEQMASKPLDVRTDIYSFGRLLCRMVAKSDPIRANNPPDDGSEGRAHFRELRSNPIGDNVERIISKCLCVDPAQRYQSALELTRDVDRLTRAAAVKPISGKVLTFAVLVGICGFIFAMLLRTNALHTSLISHPTSITSYRGVEEFATLSPDGGQVAFSGNIETQSNFDIYIKLIGSDMLRRLTKDPDPDTTPVWSPDGRWIAFTRSAKVDNLMLISSEGGSEHVLAGADQLRPQTWSADSQNVLVTIDVSDKRRGGDLVAISIATGERNKILKDVILATLSHDGHKLAFVSGSTGVPQLYIAPISPRLEVGEPHWLSWVKGKQFGGCTWTASDRDLVCSIRIAFPNPPNLWRVDTERNSVPALLPFSEGAWDPVITSTGKDLVFDVARVEFDVWKATKNENVSGYSPPTRVAWWPKANSKPEYSPDGTRLAFLSSRSGQLQVGVAASNGSGLQTLTSLSGVDSEPPRWSLDGRSIVFVREHEIYTVDAASATPRHVVSNQAVNASYPSYSHDQKWIYFASDRTGRSEIWKIPVVGGSAVRITKDGGIMALESSDGVLVYLTIRGHSYEARAILSPASQERLLFTSRAGSWPPPQLALTGGGLFYIRFEHPDKPISIEYIDLRTSAEKTILSIDMPQRFSGGSLSASPDGKSLLFSLVDFEDDLMRFEKFQ
jgi:eukaryotic-like serine/threonine-protein kinase